MSHSSLHTYLSTLPEYSSPPYDRLTFLYSSLAPRRLNNPTGYQSAISFWTNLLFALTERGLLGDDLLVLNLGDKLKETLRWERVGCPISLGLVVGELSSTSQLISLSSFLSSTPPIPSSSTPSTIASSWTSLLSRPLVWSFGLLKASLLGDESSGLGEISEEEEWKKRKGDWVVVEIVEKVANALVSKFLEIHSDPIDRLYTLQSFRNKLNSLNLLSNDDITPTTTSDTTTKKEFSEKDCNVLLHYMSLRRHCILKDDAIKFSPPLSTTTSTPPLTITSTDLSLLSLLSTLTSLSSSINSLESRISSEVDKARNYLERKDREGAKKCLERKKRLEVILGERREGREKVERVREGIERAQGDEETMRALSLGTSVLRNLLSSPLLDLDHISETNQALQDTLLDAKEVDDAVNAGMVDGGEVDEEELRKELEELIKGEKENEAEVEEEKEKKLREAGEVPSKKVGESREEGENEEKVKDGKESAVEVEKEIKVAMPS